MTSFLFQQLRLAAWAAICILAAALAMHQCEPLPAHAQSDDAAVLLAQVATNEAGFDSLDDATAIAAISIRNTGDRDLALYLRGRFLRALAPAHARKNRPWIAGLNRAGTEPAHWPSNVAWASIRPRWLALVERMDAVLAGRIAARCDADTWGGPVTDRERIARMLSRGATVVHCGRTRNTFLRWRRS